MRITGFIVIASILAAGGWLWQGQDRSREQSATQRAEERQRIAMGIRARLLGQERLAFDTIVIGQADAMGLVDVRGQVTQSGHLAPAYGQLRRLCETGVDQAECWEIAHLETDGQIVDLGVPPVAQSSALREDPAAKPLIVEVAAQRPAPPIKPMPQGMQAAPIREKQEAENALAAVKPALPMPDRPSSQPSPQPDPSHRVARKRINARSGPGTDNPVVTKLEDGVTLALLESRGGWGRFVILGGPQTGIEAWISLRILEAL